MRRIKLFLLVTAAVASLLAMNAGPALADDDGCIGPRGDNGKCIGVETDGGDGWDRGDRWDNWDNRGAFCIPVCGVDLNVDIDDIEVGDCWYWAYKHTTVCGVDLNADIDEIDEIDGIEVGQEYCKIIARHYLECQDHPFNF